MAVLITVSAGATSPVAEMSPKSLDTASSTAGDVIVEVTSSGRREERKTVEMGRRESAQWDNGERCNERRGSKASSTRQSVVKGSTGEPKERLSRLDRKREVLVIAER